MATFPPPWESGPGAADPALSRSFSSYAGNGYAVRIPQGAVGIGVGNPAAGAPPVATAQVRFYLGGDGNLYILDNKTGQSFAVAPSTTVPRPPYYSPTRPT